MIGVRPAESPEIRELCHFYTEILLQKCRTSLISGDSNTPAGGQK
ncbi:hypothetical protein [Nocardioides sp.]